MAKTPTINPKKSKKKNMKYDTFNFTSLFFTFFKNIIGINYIKIRISYFEILNIGFDILKSFIKNYKMILTINKNDNFVIPALAAICVYISPVLMYSHTS